MANMNFKANILPATSLSYNLGSSTQLWVVYGPIHSNGLYGTINTSYGDTLPTSATEGQIFFLTTDEIGFIIPPGGTAGNALIKNSNEDGDIIWGEVNSLPNGGTTGLVLSKISNIDQDVTWTTINHVANANSALSAGSASYAINADSATQALSAGSATYALSASQDGNGNIISSTYLTIADATSNYAFKAPSEEAAIDNNDAILFSDSSNNGIITKSTIKFNGSTTSSYLSLAGTWESAPVSSVAGMTGDVVLNSLTIGEKSYNGSENITIGIADLGLSSPMTFKGVTDTTLTDGSTATSVNIIAGGTTGTLSPLTDGDVVLLQESQLEYIYSNEVWHLLGLASSYSLANHLHGNIENKGNITATATIANGDRLIIADASDAENGKLVASSISFDGTTTDLVLSKAGTWTTVSVTTAPHAVTAGYALTALTATRATTAGYATTALRATYAASSGKVSITLNDTSTWSLAIEFHKLTDYTETYKPGVGYHNTGDTDGALTLIPYAISTNPWTGDKGLYIGKNTLKWENKPILHSGNYSSYAAAASHSHSYLPLAGGTMTGNITMTSGKSVVRPGVSRSWINGRDTAIIRTTSYSGYDAIASMKTTSGAWEIGVYTSNNLWFTYTPDTQYSAGTNSGYTQCHIDSSAHIWGAVWNDYAEMRNVPEAQKNNHILKPGMCVREKGDGTMVSSTKRLERGCRIISDTYGFNIGETKSCKTPIAVSGRVLTYIFEGKEFARNYIGWPVCSGPNGTVSIMTEEEEEKYPSRIIGTISEIPDYEEWGTGKVKVDGRIWIYVK